MAPRGRRLRARARRRVFSPLTLRILAVNVIALGILAGGVLYLNEFRDEMVERRIEELKTQTRIIAGALGEAATGGPEANRIDVAAARQILGRLVGRDQIRARLFSAEGELLADSRFMYLGRSVVAVELPPLDAEESWASRLGDLVDALLGRIARPPKFEPYVERVPQRASDYPEVIAALNGDDAVAIRALADGPAIIGVTAPVQRFRRVLGALLISADTRDIEAMVRRERITFMKVFLISLGVTLLLSIFLASTIARPIRRLSQAADRVRGGLGREVRLPAYASRDDEIGDLTRSIAEMTQALYRQIDAVERFAADVAHEIKNPLSSLRSAVETVDRTQDPALQAKLLQIVKDDVTRLDRLISDISDASRLDAELSRGKMERLDLGQLVGNLVEVYRTTLDENGPKIAYKPPPPGSTVVEGLETRLGQVVRNIVNNAITFSPPNSTIRVAVEPQARIVRLVIEDEGTGIPENAKEDIFKRFYSERPASEAFGTHSGLGLSISKQIVEAHDGSIRAENRYEGEEVKGARFVVELPRAG